MTTELQKSIATWYKSGRDFPLEINQLETDLYNLEKNLLSLDREKDEKKSQLITSQSNLSLFKIQNKCKNLKPSQVRNYLNGGNLHTFEYYLKNVKLDQEQYNEASKELDQSKRRVYATKRQIEHLEEIISYLNNIITENGKIVYFGKDVPSETGDRCEHCSSTDAHFVSNPYSAELYNDHTKEYICDDCSWELAQEI